MAGAHTEKHHFSWAPLSITIDVLTRCNRSIVVVSMKVWVDHMVIKKATLSNFRILKDSVGDVLLTHRIVAGRLSVEIFRTSEHH